MGAEIEIVNERKSCGEPIADIVARSSQLKGTTIVEEEIPFLIDEIPVLAVAMAVAEGESEVSGAEELRVKESDRIQAICEALSKMGVAIEERRDGFKIKGPNKLKGSAVSSYGDHRIAMALSIAALLAEGETVIKQAQCIDVSFPGFPQLLKEVIES